MESWIPHLLFNFFETAAGTNTSSTSDDILDFSERNPFGEVDDY